MLAMEDTEKTQLMMSFLAILEEKGEFNTRDVCKEKSLDHDLVLSVVNSMIANELTVAELK